MLDRSSVAAMLTRLRNLFLQGIALLTPLALTIALLVWLGHSVEVVVGGILKQFLPTGWYIPGLGFAVGLVLIAALGLVANVFLVRWLLILLERILDRIPLVKSLFQGLKDVARFFEQDGDKQMGRPVSVSLPLADGDMRLVGFLMQEQADLPTGDSPNPGRGDDRAPDGLMAVYLPMSYQVGGYTLYLDPARVSPLDVRREDALRAVLTGGSLTGNGKSAKSEGRRAGRTVEARPRRAGEGDGRSDDKDSPTGAVA
jgi:uncharacterized membrane protein